MWLEFGSGDGFVLDLRVLVVEFGDEAFRLLSIKSLGSSACAAVYFRLPLNHVTIVHNCSLQPAWWRLKWVKPEKINSTKGFSLACPLHAASNCRQASRSFFKLDAVFASM